MCESLYQKALDVRQYTDYMNDYDIR